jgi:hypothetical protein
MKLPGQTRVPLNEEARELINLYASLGDRAANILPDGVFEKLKNFIRICHDEQMEPAIQKAAINQALLEVKEALPGYTDISLMLAPHLNSKAFEFSAKRQNFKKRLRTIIDQELVNPSEKQRLENILRLHDFSVGTPPTTQETIDFLYRILVGDEVRVLRKFRDVLGINEDIEEAQWNYLLDVLDQMVNQSTHYTTGAEKENFLARTESTVNFKGLSGLIRTLVSGNADTTIRLLKEEVFTPNSVKVIEFQDPESLLQIMQDDPVSIFAIRMSSMRRNIFNKPEMANYLVRCVFIDDSPESRATNTSLVFAFHNGIINTLNKVHTRKMGTPANTQMNLRLILDKVNPQSIKKFKDKIDKKLKEYDQEILILKKEQLAEPDSHEQDVILYKFDEFASQLIKDRYALSKLRQYLVLIEQVREPATHKKINKELIAEFEDRTRDYFYSGNKNLGIATIVEGGGRAQIRTYGEYLLQRRLKPVSDEIVHRCQVILDVIPNAYQRTLHNHFHKNFGINLFLEKYKAFLTKVENEADNRGRFRNFLIDLGIKDRYDQKNPADQEIIKDFLSKLGTLDKTSVSDDVQMIIRDLLFWKGRQPNPFIYFVEEASWEYRDLFPPDRFDINPFDINIELFENGRVDFERLQTKLELIRDTFHLFDDTGTLWDRFCENTTFVINDPSNPTGYTDFNNQALIAFLKFLNKTQFTLFLDEAYNDAVKLDDPEEPKWRTVSRYIMNNFASFPTLGMVTSLSTTKNLGATGDRLGSIAATPVRQDVIDYSRRIFSSDRANTNSLFMLVNVLEIAELAKTIKIRMDENLPKDASRHKIKSKLEEYIKAAIEANKAEKLSGKAGKGRRVSLFEGSPLHLFLLDELRSLDQLDVLELPDDFKYKGEPFFSYYKEHIVKSLNRFRINKEFRGESNRRMDMAKQVAEEVLAKRGTEGITYLDSDGSYLFNLHILNLQSFHELEAFATALAGERGLAILPYQTGFVRFALGDYLDGTEASYKVFRKELETAIVLFLDYWGKYQTLLAGDPGRLKEPSAILGSVFPKQAGAAYARTILADYESVSGLSKTVNRSLRIRDIKSVNLPFAADCGVTIHTIATSKNSVIEFFDQIGNCPDLDAFVSSKAFTKVYETLLPQVYKNIPALRDLDYNEVTSRFGKSTIQKFIRSKKEFQPDHHILDELDELLVMKEILMELENLLFSDFKVKLLALKVNGGDLGGDLARLEGYNQILRKYIGELFLHFGLPFDQRMKEPGLKELFIHTLGLFSEITGIKAGSFNHSLGLIELRDRLNHFEAPFAADPRPALVEITYRYFRDEALKDTSGPDLLWMDYLLTGTDVFVRAWRARVEKLTDGVRKLGDGEAGLLASSYLLDIFPDECRYIWQSCLKAGGQLVGTADLPETVRTQVLFLTGRMNATRSTDLFTRYNHYISRMIQYEYLPQNSSINEMIQHGYSLHTNFKMDNLLSRSPEFSELRWINRVMEQCGVIAAEKDVQTHTRIATDAKKREFPFHKIDRTGHEPEPFDQSANGTPRDFIKRMKTRPTAAFFGNRIARFIETLDPEDYRCKIHDQGLVRELYIFHKSYLKYLTDNFRLLGPQTISLAEVKEFVPDIVLFYGAPEKVISYPRIGYFDLKGPNGNIKTIITPLKRKVDYFGDIKKPRLTLLNEKVKELGGMPVHGSLFAIEEEDGSIFVVLISGDSGVGKSEMLAALMLKWLRKDLKGIRSIRMIAGDMLHVFPDDMGNLYGIGSEIGDFSRVTDFDPDFIRQYKSLFESSADSNKEDLNSRSTISGLCDIRMPFKIDIFLTASNFSRDEAGIRRYANPENFILYRESHGERKEKATSSDYPHIQRTLLRYTADKQIVELLGRHGSYLDDILDWIQDPHTGKVYLGSSFKLMDKIDLEEVVSEIFRGKSFTRNNLVFRIEKIRFDIIKNRFHAIASGSTGEETFLIDRDFFGKMFNALASTPAGNPFIAEEQELAIRQHLIRILKGGSDGCGLGRKIQLGILSTDLGKKGKEISGPQKAADDLLRLIREVRLQKPEISRHKMLVRQAIQEKYGQILPANEVSAEIFRYNFYLYQIEGMKKARFVRLDQQDVPVDLSRLRGFSPVEPGNVFSPLLVTPNLNIELNAISETYVQLMALPNSPEFAAGFMDQLNGLYTAQGYSREVVINNLIIQLLLLNGYITVPDLARGRISEKVNRETVASAKYAVCKVLLPEGTDNDKNS